MRTITDPGESRTFLEHVTEEVTWGRAQISDLTIGIDLIKLDYQQGSWTPIVRMWRSGEGDESQDRPATLLVFSANERDAAMTHFAQRVRLGLAQEVETIYRQWPPTSPPEQDGNGQ